MPKLKEPVATIQEVKSLKTKVDRYLKRMNYALFGLSSAIKMNQNTLYQKINGLSTMRKTEYDKILKAIS